MKTNKLVNFPLSKIKKCKDCNTDKECEWDHALTSKGNPVYRARCIDCHRIYRRSYEKKIRLSINKRVNSLARERKLECIKQLGGKCKICGYNKCPTALTFHHKNPKDKDSNISTLLRTYNVKNDRVKKELEKCELLCFNCHMEMEELIR